MRPRGSAASGPGSAPARCDGSPTARVAGAGSLGRGRSAWRSPGVAAGALLEEVASGAGAGSSLHAASGSSRRSAAGQRVPRSHRRISPGSSGGCARRCWPGARPLPPHRPAMISAAMLIAVSSGVRAPRSSPIGLDSRSSSSSVQPGLAQPGEPVVVGTPRAHRADVRHLGQPQRHLEQGYVELRVVGEHREDGARVDPAGRRARRRGSGAASRRPPRRPPGSGCWSRRRAGRRRRSRGSRGSAPTRATAAAKSMAPKTSIRGLGANAQTKTRIPSPRRSPSGP